jgi:hypothetical protein
MTKSKIPLYSLNELACRKQNKMITRLYNQSHITRYVDKEAGASSLIEAMHERPGVQRDGDCLVFRGLMLIQIMLLSNNHSSPGIVHQQVSSFCWFIHK